MTPMDPERYHAKNHFDVIPFAECWRCGRAKAICCRKVRYESWEDADRARNEVNEREGYAQPVSRYRCRWCLLWHLTTATTKQQTRRAEKQRRKWLRREAP